MPSLSASVPANKLKVMRQGQTPSKPVARPMPGQVPSGGTASGGVSAGAAGAGGADPVSSSIGGAMKKLVPGTSVAVGPATPKLAAGGGFQFRPRDMVGGYPLPGAGGQGGGDIQTAIKSLRDQLGTSPTPTPSVEPGTDQGAPTSVASSPAQPAWKQLADLGVGGQGSAAGNRAKLAELLAARAGGGPASAEPGQPGQPNAPMSPDVAASDAYIRRMPATLGNIDPVFNSGGGGTGGATLAGNQGTMGTGLNGPSQNPYMDILSRRLSGFGGLGGRGLNPMAAGAGQYAG